MYTTAQGTAQRLAAGAPLSFQPAGQPVETQVCVFIDPNKSFQTLLGIGGALTLLDQDDILEEKGPKRVSPFTIPMLMPNGPAAAVGLAIGARGGVHAPVSACASGAEAIRWGLDLLRLDRADIVLVGGAEACVHRCRWPASPPCAP